MAYPLILRFFHILNGVIWAGVVMYVSFFLSPAAARKGPDASKAMGMLLTESRYTRVLTVTGGVSVLTGILLWLRNTAWFSALNWAQTGTGIVFTIGGILGIIALTVGLAVSAPTFNRMGEVGAEIAQSGGPPAPDRLALLGKLQTRLKNASLLGGALLALTVIAMATAQYVR